MTMDQQAATKADVLLVEDLEADATLAKRALKKSGYVHSLHWVEDGEAALDYLFARGAYQSRDAKATPKLVLLDLKLPKVNGLEVLEALRKEELCHLLPVVVMTSSREPSDIRQAYEKGANSYLVKPMDYKQYTDLLREMASYWLERNEMI